MNWAVTVYAAILFFVLTPAVLVRLPPKGGKFTVAAVHAVVFALIFHFTHKLVWQLSMGMGMPRPIRKEGMEEKEKEEKEGLEEKKKNE
jgi:sugar phosphate permease